MKTNQTLTGRQVFVVVLLAIVIGTLAVYGLNVLSTERTPTALTTEQQQMIASTLRAKGFPAPQSLEITSGRLVATFEIDDAALALMVAAGISSPKEFASNAVIALRNAELPLNLVDSYRVTMNGPPPGPGLIMRYGSARFSEGSSVTWEPGPPR